LRDQPTTEQPSAPVKGRASPQAADRRIHLPSEGTMRQSFSSAQPETVAAAGEPAVGLHNVTKVYRTGGAPVTALLEITLDFAPGTFTAVMGPSGSGKSTLLQCAAGLDRPTSGEIRLAGHDLRGLSESGLTLLRRERIGFVFQSFNLLPSLTAELNVALPLRLARRKPSRREIREVLAAVGLADRATHRPSELSGGQQQRVAIARALVTRPEVVFADEPTGMLDSASGRDVLRLLRELVDSRGQTVVMVTHDPVSAACADRVVFLADGQVAGELCGPTAQAIAARMTGLETPGGRS
jgi:putative ABC transport system ATP-binding protein